jgi:glycosyltransferase involved in cell wall biosynthesis
MLPSALLRKIPLINSQITDAPLSTKNRSLFQQFVNKINLRFSTINLANSYAGLKAYEVANKINSRVIYNGFDMKRIELLEDCSRIKDKFNIKTKYVICMVGAFADRKDYNTYLLVAKKIIKKRDDVTFLGIGTGSLLDKYRLEYKYNKRIVLPGRMSNVESIINISDICVLMTNGDVHGEGISNSIMEYMALGKPVIASDSGGTSEIIQNNKTGFVIPNKSEYELEIKILSLLNDRNMREMMGKLGKQRIIENFSIEAMTNSFIELFKG